MNLLEKNKTALLAMANGELDEASCKALQSLIEQDDECRDYWHELNALASAIRRDAEATEQCPLPTATGQRMRARLKQAMAPEPEVSYPMPFAWKPLLSFLGLAALIVLAVLRYAPQDSPSQERVEIPSESPSRNSLAPDSWGYLRGVSQQPNVQLATLPSRAFHNDIPSMNWASRDAWMKELDL